MADDVFKGIRCGELVKVTMRDGTEIVTKMTIAFDPNGRVNMADVVKCERHDR